MHTSSRHIPHTAALRRGNALFMALVVLVPLLVMGVVLMKVGLGAGNELSQETDQVRAQYLAEAGVVEAVTSMRYNLSGDVGSAAAPAVLDDGLVWVQSTPLPDDRARLLAVGMKGSGRAALDVVVRKIQSQVYRVGFVSNQSTDLSNDLFADSYDSDLGPYASQVPAGSDHAGSDVFLGGNGDITIGKASTVYGDARPGAGGTVNLVGATVTGSTSPNPEAFVMEPVDVPSLPPGGALSLGSGATILPPGDHRFSSLDLAGKGVLSIPGPAKIVIDGDVAIGSDALISVGANGPVEIYIGGDLRMGTKSSFVTPTFDPNNASIFLTGAGAFAELKSHAGFYGMVYGPQATIELDNKLEFFGALAADHFYCKNSSLRLHFDESLMRKAEPWAWEFETISWLPTAFPDRELLIDRRDPFQVLNVNKKNLSSASKAWQPAGNAYP